MKHAKILVAASLCSLAALLPAQSPAQTYTENFTDNTTSNSWTFVNGACLTSVSPSTTGGPTFPAPSCVGLPYYGSSPQPEFGGDTGVLPDTTANGGGALRFTDWFAQTGAILSNFNFTLTGAGAQGLSVSFTTVTYEGNSGGTASDGADGMSFFLQDASYPPDVGAFGGSLGYTCTNVNFDGTLRASGIPRGYDGLQGGFVGLGIDEFGNFLNQGDNTATGYGYVPMRIGLRGPGSTTWKSLSTNYPIYYPSTLTNAQGAAAVQNTCSTGFLWDYSNPATPVQTTTPAVDYAAIPGAFSVLPATSPLANEAATMRSQGVPIVYNLRVTPTGLLSLAYSYNGGALQNVITNQDITQGGVLPIPSNVRFGFAGSTGGSRNIHEIMCFQATPTQTSQSSGGLNQKQTAKVQTGTQAYFAYYNPATLAGSLTSQYVGTPTGDPNPNDLVISSTINWDGSCVLTGVPTGQICDTTGPAGPIAAEAPATRAIMTWNGSTGIPFEWSNLTAAEQTALDTGDAANPTPPPFNYSRLAYLRGDRSNEQTPTSSVTSVGTFRDRASVLGDIIDSSPTWVGAPKAPYPAAWSDRLNATGDPFAENASTAQTFAAYATANQTRTNVVYAGANDGMLHGFRSGYFSAPNTYQPATNDGYEMMAYVPGYIVDTIQTNFAPRNYSDPQYGHHFDVDASPGWGDVFYQGTWHTWLVGGLGPGGNAIYALDVTNPGVAGANGFSEGNASSTVIGEWSTHAGTTNLSCANDPGPGSRCGVNLGQTYGTPQIRRFHNGMWGAVFGNGLGSTNGDAGIYVMLVDPTTAAVTFYYLSTSTGSIPGGYTSCAKVPATPQSTCNGIFNAAPADLDGDYISDYVYAGDLLGNVWRFDLTSTNPANWGVTNNAGTSITSSGGSPTPLFTTPGGQPITSAVLAATILGSGNPRVLIEFGTGQQVAMTNFSPALYATSQQALYGIWDWNLGAWNAKSSMQFAVLPSGATAAPSSPISGTGNLQTQVIGGPYTATVAGTGSDYRTLTNNSICWADTVGCTQFGWYINLISGNAYTPDPAAPQTGNPNYANAPVVWEQVVYNPVLQLGAFIVNTSIPPANAATMCYSSAASGWTMAVNPATGGSFNQSFFVAPSSFTFLNTQSMPVSGLALGGTGSVSIMQAAGGQWYFLTQTVGSGGGPGSPNGATALPGHAQNYKGSRLTWTQRR
jgi:type IV pilus assembly protein PilY1